MPKCLDCGNTRTFSYSETQHCIGTYDEDGGLENAEGYYDKPHNGKCYECEGFNIEGEL